MQSCPRRRAGVACDERPTDAVGNSSDGLKSRPGLEPELEQLPLRIACLHPQIVRTNQNY